MISVGYILCFKMSSVIMSGLTTITTITLFDGWENLYNIAEDIGKLGCWFHHSLPENRAVKALCYCFGGVVLLRSIPFILRRTSFFSYFDNEILFFHRSNNQVELIEIKKKLLKELKEDNRLPKNEDDKMVILELNIGSGTNISYYPKDAIIIGTDFLEGNREKLEENILLKHDEREYSYIETTAEALEGIPDESISCIICFHTLCSCRNSVRALQEIKRVLMPYGKVYFIEHTREPVKFSASWFWQLNFAPSLFLVGCCIKGVEFQIDKSGFQRVSYERCHIDLYRQSRPMHALMPHVYGFAVK